jgi:hypothetical protein
MIPIRQTVIKRLKRIRRLLHFSQQKEYRKGNDTQLRYRFKNVEQAISELDGILRVIE